VVLGPASQTRTRSDAADAPDAPDRSTERPSTSPNERILSRRPREAKPPEVVPFSNPGSLRAEIFKLRSDSAHPPDPKNPNNPPSERPAR